MYCMCNKISVEIVAAWLSKDLITEHIFFGDCGRATDLGDLLKYLKSSLFMIRLKSELFRLDLKIMGKTFGYNIRNDDIRKKVIKVLEKAQKCYFR